jgi:hypothetical protein
MTIYYSLTKVLPVHLENERSKDDVGRNLLYIFVKNENRKIVKNNIGAVTFD